MNRAGMLVTLGALASACLSALAAPLSVGQRAPDFTLKDQDGKAHQLAQYRGKTVILEFYPADMTAGCTREARSIRDNKSQIDATGAVVFGISVQDQKSKREFCDKEKLNYTLLADTSKGVSRSYGVLMPNGYAQRVTYVVGPDGRITHVIDQVNVDTHGADLVTLLAPPQAVKATIGGIAPIFTLPTAADGKPVPLFPGGNSRPAATVVIFIATQCPVSNAYNERMATLASNYAQKGVRFIGINANRQESAQEVAAHAKEKGFPFPVLKDASNQVADKYDARVTPEAYVIDSRGVLRYHGRIDDSMDQDAVKSRDLSLAIDAVLAGKEPPRTETKAFGCAIKRAKS